MQRISIAFRAFFAALLNAELAQSLAAALSTAGGNAPVSDPPETASKPQPVKQLEGSVRSEAVSLLSALQREARFVAFVQRDCAAVLNRMFAIQPLLEQEEGEAVGVPAGFDSARYRLTGNVSGQPPYQGRLEHHGWQATKCEIPSWSGSDESALVVSPAQVEL